MSTDFLHLHIINLFVDFQQLNDRELMLLMHANLLKSNQEAVVHKISEFTKTTCFKVYNVSFIELYCINYGTIRAVLSLTKGPTHEPYYFGICDKTRIIHFGECCHTFEYLIHY